MGWSAAVPALAAEPGKSPLLVLLDGDAAQWQSWCATARWEFLGPWTDLKEPSIDLRIKALENRIAEIRKRANIDETRVYVAGQGEGAAAVFYLASRAPDLWAAAVALGGSPRPAMDSNRLYAANTTNVPVLWLSAGTDDQKMADQLKTTGFNLEWRTGRSVSPEVIFQWLGEHRRDATPATVDCETGTPSFPRCYWIEMTKFDPAERNDVLVSTRVTPVGSGAALDLGGFGYSAAEAGPGVLVSWLPPKYEGPLKLNDRIMEIGGKPLANAQAYVRMMDQTVEEKPVAVSVRRGKERVRLETRIVVPKREETVTARVQGRYLPDLHEIQILSRTVAQMRITVPQDWVPASINWNGSDLVKAETAGCWLLNEQKELLSAAKCP